MERYAKELDSEEQSEAEMARKLIELIENPPPPSELDVLLRNANEAANREDWVTAINCIRNAIKIAGSKTPPELNKQLAICLANHAILTVNSVMAKINSGESSLFYDMQIEQLRQAEKNLVEASKLEPSSNHIKNNLSQLKELLSKLPSSSRSSNISNNRKLKIFSDIIVTYTYIWVALACIALVKGGMYSYFAYTLITIYIISLIGYARTR